MYWPFYYFLLVSNISNFTSENTRCTELRENLFQHAKKTNSLGGTRINKLNFP